MTIIIMAALSGYLIGALSFTRILTQKMSPDVDLSAIVVKDEKTGEVYHRVPNATTASMALGWKAGCLIGVLDMAKSLVPVLVWRYLFPGEVYHLVAAVCAVAGNNWPVYYRFKGGSGLSAIYGGLLAIDPLGILVTVGGGFFVGMIVLRSMMLTFILPLLLLIPWFWYRTGDFAYVLYALGLNILYFTTFAVDIKEYLSKGKSNIISERAVMEQMPMGRGMLKMLEKLGIQKK
jgi:acyl phosphate:glycerol-3-phosphate acyltransferase